MMQTYETKIIFDECVVCHRHTSLGHMGILFHEKEKPVRICSWCDNGW